MRPLILFEKSHLKRRVAWPNLDVMFQSPKVLFNWRLIFVNAFFNHHQKIGSRMIQVQCFKNTQLSTLKWKLPLLGFLCGFALQNKKYILREGKCRILDFIRFMVSRDFGKPSFDTISIWMCSRAFLHMFWSALTREQIEKGKQDRTSWTPKSGTKQQKRSSLTMFTGLSYRQLVPTHWQATEQFKNTRDPYKSTHNLQYLSYIFLFLTSHWQPGPGPHSFAAFRQSRPHSHGMARAVSPADGGKVSCVMPGPPRTLRCISASRFCSHSWWHLVTICDHGGSHCEQSGIISAFVKSVKITWHQKSLPSINFLVLC